MSLPLMFASAAAGGLINLLSADKEREDAIRRNDIVIADLKDSMIDFSERQRYIDKISDSYNTNLLSELNTSSIPIATVGAGNPGSARSEIAGKVLGQRTKSILDLEFEIDAYNRQLQSKITQVEAGVPSQSNSISDFLIGAASTLPIGLGISEAIDTQDNSAKLEDILNPKKPVTDFNLSEWHG